MGTVSRRRSRSFFPRVSSRIPRLPGGEGRENDLRVKLAGFMTRDKRGRRGGGGEEEGNSNSIEPLCRYRLSSFPRTLFSFFPSPSTLTRTRSNLPLRDPNATPVLSILRFITRRKAKVSGTRWNVRFVNWNGTFSRE